MEYKIKLGNKEISYIADTCEEVVSLFNAIDNNRKWPKCPECKGNLLKLETDQNVTIEYYCQNCRRLFKSEKV
jgi:uncharacterized protein with PIN domain